MQTLHGKAVAASLMLALSAVALGCGGDGDEAQGFCEDLVAVNDDLAAAGQPSTDQADDIVAALEELDPPGEIEDAYDNVRALYRQIADGDTALTDPALATDFANLETDIREIQTFTAEECGPNEDE